MIKRWLTRILCKELSRRTGTMWQARNRYYYVDFYGYVYELRPTGDDPSSPFIIVLLHKP